MTNFSVTFISFFAALAWFGFIAESIAADQTEASGMSNAETQVAEETNPISGESALEDEAIKAPVPEVSPDAFIFNNSVYQLTGNDNDLFPAGAVIKGSGAKIDTGDFFASINSNITRDVSLGSASDGGFTKLGAGRLTLGGDNTFVGKILVNQGTLLVNNSEGSGLGKGNVVIGGGATLSGVGFFSGGLKIEKGGKLAPGDDVQALTGGGVVFENGSIFEINIDSSAIQGTQSDLYVGTGIVLSVGTPPFGFAVGKDVELKIEDLAKVPTKFAAGTVFSILNYAGDWNQGVFTVGGEPLKEGGEFDAGLTKWQISYRSEKGGGNFVNKHQFGRFVNITAQLGAAEDDSKINIILMVGGAILLLGFGGFVLLRNRHKAA